MDMEKLKELRWEEIPQEYQKQIKLVPTEPFYIVIDENDGQEMGMNDAGGRKRYGPDWELIRENVHEDYSTSLLKVTVH